MRLKNAKPLRVDPAFTDFCRNVVAQAQNPNIRSMRDVTTVIPQKSHLIGQILINEDFERQVDELFKKGKKGFNL